MPPNEGARNYTEEEIDAARSEGSVKNVLNTSALRRAALEGKEDTDKTEKSGLNQEGKAKLDVLQGKLDILDRIRQTNPELRRNTLLETEIQSLREADNPMEQLEIQRRIGSYLAESYEKIMSGKSETGEKERKMTEQATRFHRPEWTQQMRTWAQDANTQSLGQMINWMSGTQQEIAKRRAPFEALEKTIKEVDGLSTSQQSKVLEGFYEQMANQSRTANLQYTKSVEENVKEFNGYMKDLPKLSKENKERLTKDFLNVSTAEQKRELERLKDLTKTKHLDEKFKQFSEERQEQVKDFHRLSKGEKEAAISKLTRELSDEYQKEYRRGMQYMTPQDIKLFEQTINSKDIALLEAGLKDMPNVVTGARETHHKGEELRKEIEKKAGEKMAKDVFTTVGWNHPLTTSWDRKKLLERNTIKQVFEGQEIKERKKQIKKYEDKIDTKVGPSKMVEGHTLMHEKGRNANKKWFKQLSTKEQADIIKTGDYIDKTIDKRKKINKRYSELPPETKKEFDKVYENLGMEERESLTKKIEEARKRNTKTYESQLDQAASEDLIPDTKKAKDELTTEFNNLSLREQSKRKKRDKTIYNPQLVASVKAFKRSFANLPSSKFMPALEEFQKLTHGHERITFVRKFLSENYQPENDKLNDELEELEVKELQELEEKSFRDEMADNQAEEAKEAFETGDTKNAAEKFQKASDIDEERDDLKIMAEILEESANKEAPIPPHIMDQSEEALGQLMKSEEFKAALENLYIADLMIQQIEMSRQQRGNIKEADKRSEKALKKTGNEEAIQLQEEMTARETETGKQDHYVIHEEQGDLQSTQILNVRFDNQHNDLAGSSQEDKTKRRQVIEELRKNEGSQRGLDTVDFTDEKGQVQETESAMMMREKMADEQKMAMQNAISQSLAGKKIPATLAERAAKQTVDREFERRVSSFKLRDIAA